MENADQGSHYHRRVVQMHEIDFSKETKEEDREEGTSPGEFLRRQFCKQCKDVDEKKFHEYSCPKFGQLR